MRARKLMLLSGVALLSLLVSIVILAQITAKNDDLFTQADFVEALTRALGLENQLGPTTTTTGKAGYLEDVGYVAHARPLGLTERLGPAATTRDRAKYLESLGYAPPNGWELEKIMTKGDVAFVLSQILGVHIADNAVADDYIESLALLGIMKPGKADSPFSLDDLVSAINIAAGMPDLAERLLQPYHAAMSPVK